MTDEIKGQGQSQGKEGHVNETAQDSIQTVTAKLKVAQDAIKAQVDQIAELTEKLKQANDVIEGFERAPLISEIVNRSNIPIEDLSKKTTTELRDMLATLNSAIAPTAKGIRFQTSADAQDKLEGLTVGNLLGKKLGEK